MNRIGGEDNFYKSFYNTNKGGLLDNSNLKLGSNSSTDEDMHRNFYDVASIRIFFFYRGEMIAVYPEEFSLSIDFDIEEQFNLKGQLVGVLRSSCGGDLEIALPENMYYADRIYPILDVVTKICVMSRAANSDAFFADILTCTLVRSSFSTSLPRLNHSLSFRVSEIYRTNDLRKEFSPLFLLNSAFFIPIRKDDKDYLTLIYDDAGVERTLDIYHITSFEYQSKLRGQVDNLERKGEWYYIYNGVEPATLKVGANLYDIINFAVLESIGEKESRNTRDTSSNKAGTSLLTLTKEHQASLLCNLLEKTRKVGGSGRGVVPYEIYIKSILLVDLRPVEYTFHLTNVSLRSNPKNYIEVDLEFIEVREKLKKGTRLYKPKNASIRNRSQDLHDMSLLTSGKMSLQDRSRALRIMGD